MLAILKLTHNMFISWIQPFVCFLTRSVIQKAAYAESIRTVLEFTNVIIFGYVFE